MSTTDIHRLMTLMEHERAALQRADLGRLDRLMHQKSALLARIEAQRAPDSPALTRLRTAAARNARLFEALIAGLHEARALIAGLRDGTRDSTYGRDGTRARLHPPAGSLHRQA